MIKTKVIRIMLII